MAAAAGHILAQQGEELQQLDPRSQARGERKYGEPLPESARHSHASNWPTMPKPTGPWRRMAASPSALDRRALAIREQAAWP
jgi:hypothetical protein